MHLQPFHSKTTRKEKKKKKAEKEKQRNFRDLHSQVLSQGAKQNGVYSNAVMDAKKGSKGNLYVRVENGEYQIRKLVQRKA